MTDSEFKQWFVGFTDAEGCFRIAINNNNKVISFNFAIGLHIDDQEVLQPASSKLCFAASNKLRQIKNKLNCGNVYISENAANFVVPLLALLLT